MHQNDKKIKVERTQLGVRMEKRLVKVLKAMAEYYDLSLGDLLEGIVLHAFEGKSPFSTEAIQKIDELKKIYGVDYDSSASHMFIEDGSLSASKLSRIVVTTVWAEDVSAAAHFYRDVVGLQPFVDDHHTVERPHFKLNGGYLVILKGQPRPAENTEPEHFPLFALSVDDLDKAVEQLKAHNVTLPWGVQSEGQQQYVMFHDPAGNLIELVQGL